MLRIDLEVLQDNGKTPSEKVIEALRLDLRRVFEKHDLVVGGRLYTVEEEE